MLVAHVVGVLFALVRKFTVLVDGGHPSQHTSNFQRFASTCSAQNSQTSQQAFLKYPAGIKQPCSKDHELSCDATLAHGEAQLLFNLPHGSSTPRRRSQSTGHMASCTNSLHADPFRMTRNQSQPKPAGGKRLCGSLLLVILPMLCKRLTSRSQSPR